MKNYPIVLLLVSICPALVASELYVDTTMGFESEYIFRGLELDEEIAQGSVDLYYRDFSLGVWTVESLSGDDYSELDVYGAYSFEFASVFTADVGICYYYYPDDESDSSTEPYLGLIANIPFMPSLYFYYDIDLKVATIELSAMHSYEVSEKTRLDMGLTLGKVIDADSSDDFEDYCYALGLVNYVIQLSQSSSISMGVRASTHDLDDSSEAQPNTATIWGGFSFNYGF